MVNCQSTDTQVTIKLTPIIMVFSISLSCSSESSSTKFSSSVSSSGYSGLQTNHTCQHYCETNKTNHTRQHYCKIKHNYYQYWTPKNTPVNTTAKQNIIITNTDIPHSKIPKQNPKSMKFKNVFFSSYLKRNHQWCNAHKCNTRQDKNWESGICPHICLRPHIYLCKLMLKITNDQFLHLKI